MSSSSYTFSVSSVNVNTNIALLQTRITQDPVLTISLSGITYSDPILTVSFVSSLTPYQIYVLDTMINTIFNSIVYGVDLPYYSTVLNPRSIYSGSHVPTITDDVYSGYGVGSIIYNTNENYLCTSSVAGSAVWLKQSKNNPSNSYLNVARSTSLSITTTETAISFTDTLFNSQGWTVSSTDITLPNAGNYSINYSIELLYTASSTVGIRCKLNGVVIPQSYRISSQGFLSTNNTLVSCNFMINVPSSGSNILTLTARASSNSTCSISMSALYSGTSYPVLFNISQVN